MVFPVKDFLDKKFTFLHEQNFSVVTRGLPTLWEALSLLIMILRLIKISLRDFPQTLQLYNVQHIGKPVNRRILCNTERIPSIPLFWSPCPRHTITMQRGHICYLPRAGS